MNLLQFPVSQVKACHMGQNRFLLEEKKQDTHHRDRKASQKLVYVI